MAKRSRKKKAVESSVSTAGFNFKASLSGVWVALLLAVVAFLAYWPSLKSDLVYDAHAEIIDEGFVLSLANLPAVLSLKVLGMNLILGARPGQLLYLMLNAAVWGREPFGYHLSSNLLHAANVALLFVLLRRLIATEMTGLAKSGILKVQLALAAVVLIFALHPIAVESVSEVSYSSSLLVTFFTLLALLAATAFRPDHFRIAMLAGSVGTLCAFASVTCKESGLATALLLIVYWFLFRRRETKLPWILFLSAGMVVTAAFLAARFLWVPPSLSQIHINYLGGSFSQVFLIQPRLWTVMTGKLFWPVQFSADYTWEDMGAPSTPFALVILIVVVLLQVWLACRSRIGALGVAIYWLGLATVSNFIPLYRPLADRFYYMPLAGVTMQLLALLLMILGSSRGFWMAVASCFVALLPLTVLTMMREGVFASEYALWKDTLQVSPRSWIAHANYGDALSQKGDADGGIRQIQEALKIAPTYVRAHYNLGVALFQKGQADEASAEYQKALDLNPNHTESRNNLGLILLQKGQVDKAIGQFQKVLEINPGNAEAHNNYGLALVQKERVDDAIVQYQKALDINPSFAEAHNNLGVVLFPRGKEKEALAHFQEAVRLKPDLKNAQDNLAEVKDMMRQKKDGK